MYNQVVRENFQKRYLLFGLFFCALLGGAFLKYIVGYPISENQAFLQSILESKEHISEVYFSYGDMPNGRSALGADSAETPFELQLRQMTDLKRLSAAAAISGFPVPAAERASHSEYSTLKRTAPVSKAG
jgi:hypothetical protein